MSYRMVPVVPVMCIEVCDECGADLPPPSSGFTTISTAWLHECECGKEQWREEQSHRIEYVVKQNLTPASDHQ